METIVINNTTYKIPASVVEHNSASCPTYGVLFLSKVFTGNEDFDRIEKDGGDWMNESDCFSAYGEAMGVNGDDALIRDVGSSMFAWFKNRKGDEFEMHMLVKA